jgi:hypothetical protein
MKMGNHMSKKFFLIPGLLLIIAFLFLIAVPVTASPLHPQAVQYTPTPDEAGRYLYVVEDGDTCLSIALRFMDGDVNKLVELNSLDADCLIATGQELLLGVFELPSITPGPSPTPAPIIPTPTPFPGNGIICIYLFDDTNGNARAEPDEVGIAGGAISITDREGVISLIGTTISQYDLDEEEYLPVCFEEIPEGEYNVSVGPPEGYNPTTIMNYALALTAGDQTILDFGAQVSSAAAVIPPQSSPGENETEAERSPLMAILGGVMILAGVGLGFYYRFLRRG